MVNIAELRKKCQVEHDKSPYKVVSIYFTYAALKIGLSPGAVTIMELITVIIGGSLVTANTLSMIWLLGGALFILGDILDKVNGELARYYGVQSWKGALIDGIADSIKMIIVFTSVSLGLYNTTKVSMYIVLGYIVLASLLIYNFVEKTTFHIYAENKVLPAFRSYDDVKVREKIKGFKKWGLTLISAFSRNTSLLIAIVLDLILSKYMVINIICFTGIWLILYSTAFVIGSTIRCLESLKLVQLLDKK